MHLVQITHPERGRAVAIVDEPRLALVGGAESVYELALAAIAAGVSVAELAEQRRTDESLVYDAVYQGGSTWRLLTAFDCPDHPERCLVTGTGLTHRASAANREKMHQAAAAGDLTDSMRMYQWGVEGGRPPVGSVGSQPEWFYKGDGSILRGHGEGLTRPPFADDAGEEPEVAAAYVIDDDGRPWRIGFAPGNEFADHAMEKKNYLNLAHSKLRECAIGPELSLTHKFDAVDGRVTITRNGKEFWSHDIQSGEQHMAHSLANLEHHHFKYPHHRHPRQAHVHFFGAAAFSFGAGVTLAEGDLMRVEWRGLGRPLVNPLRVAPGGDELVEVRGFGEGEGD